MSAITVGATLAAMRRAISFVSNFAAERRPGSSSIGTSERPPKQLRYQSNGYTDTTLVDLY
jgi:hypothetical protein